MASIKFTKAIEEKRFFSCFTVIMTLKHEKNMISTMELSPNNVGQTDTISFNNA